MALSANSRPHFTTIADFISKKRLFLPQDFIFAEDLSHATCPAGKRLYRSGSRSRAKNYLSYRFKGRKQDCTVWALRRECLRHTERTEIRQVAYFTEQSSSGELRFTERMKRKIDTAVGRTIYGMRLAVGEPPFAHIRSLMRLDRFSLRGKRKVNTQWNLFCVDYNLKKVHTFGKVFG